MRIPLISAIILVIFSILVDLYILSDIRKYSVLKRKKIYSTIYLTSSVILWIFIIVVLCLPRQNEDDSVLAIVWMLFSYLSIYLSKFIYCLISIIGRLVKLITQKGKNYAVYIGLIAGIFTFCILWWGVIFTRNKIEINKIEIVSSKLPESFNGMKVVQFSDLHLGTFGNDTTFVSKFVDSINNLNPDLILFTGDFVNRKGSELKPFKNVLSRLSSKYGVYAVYGNHDYGGYVKWNNKDDYHKNLQELHNDIKEMGWKMLNNHTKFISENNDTIILIGVHNWGEPPFNQLGDLGKSYPENNDKLKSLNDNNFKILMTHNPEHWNQVVTNISNIDLTLSGHTHAMQTIFKIGNIKWSPAALRYKYWGGLYDKKAKDGTDMKLYVNIGAGEVGFPARIGAAYPEITLITLHSK